MGSNPKTASAQADCLLLVRHTIRDVLLDIHPESNALHLENIGAPTQ